MRRNLRGLSGRGTVLVAAVLLIGSTAEAGRKKSVYRDPGSITSSGTRWSDTDVRLVTQKMVESMITSTFHKSSEEESEDGEKSEKPLIAMGKIENRTTQSIDTKLIIETIETSVLKSGAARFVNRSQQFRETAADEMALQQTMGDGSAAPTALITYQYRVDGSLFEIVEDNGKSRYYKLGLSLTNIRTSEKMWADEAELKKVKD